MTFTKSIRSKIRAAFPWLQAFGISPFAFVHGFRRLSPVVKEFREIKKQNNESGNKWDLKFSIPCIHDKFDSSGVASGHYFHQDLLVARKIFLRQPEKHVDIGSRVDGFVAHVSIFRPIEVFDMRPLALNVPNITYRQCDLMNLITDLENYCDSISCLHALEHFGLGRYGDNLDIDGYVKGFDNLYKILKPDGILYLSVPIGNERIEFNAHRVFAIKTILEMAEERFQLIEFSYVDDKGDLHENIEIYANAIDNNFGLSYGCGIFELKKIKPNHVQR